MILKVLGEDRARNRVNHTHQDGGQKLFGFYLINFFWLRQVLVAACKIFLATWGIFVVACGLLVVACRI